MTQVRDMVDTIKLAVVEICLQAHPDLAERYFREIVESKSVLTLSDVHVFNRLDIALRKQGNGSKPSRSSKKF